MPHSRASPVRCSPRRFRATPSLAGALTIVGRSGLMAGWVADSRRDFGLRLALGATRREILAMVVGRGLRVTVWGAALDVALALAGGRWLSGLLFGVLPSDPPVTRRSDGASLRRMDPCESLRTGG